MAIYQLSWSKTNPSVLHARRLTCFKCDPGENCIHYSIGTIYIDNNDANNEIRQSNIQQDPIPIIEKVYNDEVDIENDEGNGENIRNHISREAVLKLWIHNRIFCNLGNRLCPEHFENLYFFEECVALLRLRAAPRQLTHGDNECLINLLPERVVAVEEKSKIFDFYNENMDDDDCKYLTGLSKAQFATVVALVDATYLYHEQSVDHLSQRMTYSLPKRLNLKYIQISNTPDVNSDQRVISAC
ncbi:unnamed protein product [Psylliodes chrysocephalus]|uniref:Uncharacterized protein n=1 Tax=Psylliodes chrysocephalus TaxID=3402493 RepID=A0A9P0CIJ1_9CUCU|nr:unnamed protein product [Psylliodes chrysocephala]